MLLTEVHAKAERGGVSSSYIKDAFTHEAMEFPGGTGAFTVLRRATGREEKELGRVGNHFPIRMKSELRLSDSLMLPLRCSDDGDRCVSGSLTSPELFDHEQNMNAR